MVLYGEDVLDVQSLFEKYYIKDEREVTKAFETWDGSFPIELYWIDTKEQGPSAKVDLVTNNKGQKGLYLKSWHRNGERNRAQGRLLLGWILSKAEQENCYLVGTWPKAHMSETADCSQQRLVEIYEAFAFGEQCNLSIQIGEQPGSFYHDYGFNQTSGDATFKQDHSFSNKFARFLSRVRNLFGSVSAP